MQCGANLDQNQKQHEISLCFFFVLLASLNSLNANVIVHYSLLPVFLYFPSIIFFLITVNHLLFFIYFIFT